MKGLLKVALALALAFASTALIVKATGLVSERSALAFIEAAKEINPLYLGVGVVLLLAIDLLIAVPTMTTILIAGYAMGPLLGGASAATGLMLLGLGGYGMGRRFGRPILARLFKDGEKLAEIERAFAKNDLLTLFACQALPILPELSCTIAGITRMRFRRFLFGYSVGVIPFAFIVAWAGSKSTLSNPAPAIYAAITVSVGLLLAWTLIRRRSSCTA
ncbi:TVP38/TMEM64 family protein [Bosea sp. BIWAKO-01]|uniref:TVP38/TMEM64 family protein n=1 Tax=Bosea sp. BIWAKO-01 TaxID=506668 RepID=UPI000868D164|nr:VTT domain-containing protein [Bosea sp. BIWAKO-01]GAU86468.1 hypothetical protein BIWAKO_06416 [Bosea sp. BIWAKO-01]